MGESLQAGVKETFVLVVGLETHAPESLQPCPLLQTIGNATYSRRQHGLMVKTALGSVPSSLLLSLHGSEVTPFPEVVSLSVEGGK